MREQTHSIVVNSFINQREKDIKNLWGFGLHYIQLKAILKEKNMI